MNDFAGMVTFVILKTLQMSCLVFAVAVFVSGFF